MTQLHKNTLGDSPAALYLIDTLNSSTNSIDRNVLKKISNFHKTFNELLAGHRAGILSQQTIDTFIAYQRASLKEQALQMQEHGYTPLVINLYKNLVCAELKKFRRESLNLHTLERSASDRAKALLRNRHQNFKNQEVATYGKLQGEKIPLNVQFNDHGLPQVTVDKSLIKDPITSETLMQKSQARLKRLGKISTLYK